MDNNYLKVEHELHVLIDRLCEDINHDDIMKALITYAKLHRVVSPVRKFKLEEDNE